MTKIYKTLSVTLAIFFAVSFVGNRVKAIEAGAVVVTAEIVAAFAFFLSEALVPDVAEGISSAATSYGNAMANDNYVSDDFRSKIDQLKDLYSLKMAKEEVENFVKQNSNLLVVTQTPPYNLVFQSGSAGLYLSQQQAIGNAQLAYVQLAYNTLLAAEKQTFLIEENMLKTTGNVFSALYDDVLSNTVSNFLDIPVDIRVSEQTGFSLRQISMKYPSLPDYFPSLAVKYGATQIYYRDSYGGGAIFTSVSAPVSDMHYCVVIGEYQNKTLCSPAFSLPHATPYESSQIYRIEAGYEISKGIYVQSSILSGIKVVEKIFPMTYIGSYTISAPFADYSSSSDWFLFDFKSLELAQAFASDIISDTTYNPSEDKETDSDRDTVVVDVNQSSVEKAIEQQKSNLGVDDVDITVSPGATVDDDGETVYSPTLSVAGTDIKDIDNDKDNSKDSESDSSKNSSNEFILGLASQGWGSGFTLYDQCKLIISNVFNYDDVVDPPSFKFYWDSNGDGESEIYDVLDLSFLETTLTNDNMEDKGWFATPIKAIDLLRYIIAAVIYGLFAMRLIKRLPTFYGSGPFTGL